MVLSIAHMLDKGVIIIDVPGQAAITQSGGLVAAKIDYRQRVK